MHRRCAPPYGRLRQKALVCGLMGHSLARGLSLASVVEFLRRIHPNQTRTTGLHWNPVSPVNLGTMRSRENTVFQNSQDSVKRQGSSDELLTVANAAAALGISPWTLRHWISDRKIDVVKYGNGIVRIKRSVVDRYVVRCTIKARGNHGKRPEDESRLLEGAGLEPSSGSLAR
jgi:excisionase family DNA binding protein